MVKSYTEKEITEHIDKALETEDLYKAKSLNYTGCTSDTKESYEELTAKYLLQNDINKYFTKFVPIDRKEGYKVKSHHISNLQREKYFAKGLKDCEIQGLGKIIDFEIPLNTSTVPKCGNIDIISKDDTSKTIHIIELKHSTNTETVLRCILEISTYYQRLNKKRFLENFDAVGYKIQKTVLVLQGSNAGKELKKIKAGKYPYFKQLAEQLDVDLFTLDLKLL